MKRLAIVLALLMVCFFQLSAQVPRTLSYQGILSDTAGVPKPNANYGITFRLYNVAQNGAPLWSETQILGTKRGLFSAVLGDITPFPDTLRFDRRYWLGIQVSPDPELTPRIQLTATGYSINARTADTARFALASGSGGGGLSLPYSGSAASSASAFDVTNNGSGAGVSSSSTGGTGVSGTSSNGIGVRGISAFNDGIVGTSASAGRSGVWGHDDVTGGVGVSGSSISGTGLSGTSTNGVGVSGNSASDFGIVGSSSGFAASGVWGKNDLAFSSGVQGSSTDGTGVYGVSTNAFGVVGSSTNYVGVYGSSANGTAIFCGGKFYQDTGIFEAHPTSTIWSTNKPATVKLQNGTSIKLFSEEAAEIYFTDYGEGQLANGRTHIDLDPKFLQTVTIDERHPIKVFIQEAGECNGMYFTNRTSTGFDVAELHNGSSNAPFVYRVVCKRKYYEDERLATQEEDLKYNTRVLQVAWPEVLRKAEEERARVEHTSSSHRDRPETKN